MRDLPYPHPLILTPSIFIRYHGISPSRLLFVPTLPWKDHLHRAPAICDFVLDTFVYGAHTTVSDMLWMTGSHPPQQLIYNYN